MKVLIVVDMQNDFVDGALGTPEARAIVPNVCERIKGFDGVIAATFDTHQDDYLATQEGENLPVVHCLYGTPGWELNASVRAALTAHGAVQEFHKPTFGSVALAQWLDALHKEKPIDEVLLIGLCTDICVISNAMLIKAFLPEVQVTVDASCCAGVTPASHTNALEAMKMCQIQVQNM